MALFKNVIRRLRFWKRTKTEPVRPKHDLTRTLKKYEYFVYKTQCILLWENPSETIFTVAVVHVLFWIFATFEWKFYGLFFMAVLSIVLFDLWIQIIWPEIRFQKPSTEVTDRDSENFCSDDEEYHDTDADGDEEKDSENPQRVSLRRLSHFLGESERAITKNYLWLKNLREKRPGMFCTLVSGVFITFSFIGRLVSGLFLTYVIIVTVMFLPGIWVHCIPEETKKVILSHLSSLQHMLYCSDDLPSEEDYLPDATNEELSLLSQFVEPENEETNSRGSSVTRLSFATSAMPSHDDTSVDSLATFSDLDLNLESIPRTVQDVEDFSDDSSVANDIGIDFQATHFNGDELSSEEEEKAFTKDLKFTETTDSGGGDSAMIGRAVAAPLQSVTTADPHQSTISNFLSSNLMGLTSAIGQTYLANVLNISGSANEKQETMTKNNSSDSLGSEEDFEMISHEDVS